MEMGGENIRAKGKKKLQGRWGGRGRREEGETALVFAFTCRHSVSARTCTCTCTHSDRVFSNTASQSRKPRVSRLRRKGPPRAQAMWRTHVARRQKCVFHSAASHVHNPHYTCTVSIFHLSPHTHISRHARTHAHTFSPLTFAKRST